MSEPVSLEHLTTAACGMAAFLIPIDGGLTAVAVGGAGLFDGIRRRRRKHGIESDRLLSETRIAIIREINLTDPNSQARDTIGAADCALALHLRAAIPSSDELASAALAPKNFSENVSEIIVERLAKLDPIFGGGLARE